MRVAESSDLLEVIFEHCGLLHLDTLKRVCRSWYNLARAMPTRWATATISGHMGDELEMMRAYCAARLPDDVGLAVAVASTPSRVMFFLFHRA